MSRYTGKAIVIQDEIDSIDYDLKKIKDEITNLQFQEIDLEEKLKLLLLQREQIDFEVAEIKLQKAKEAAGLR